MDQDNLRSFVKPSWLAKFNANNIGCEDFPASTNPTKDSVQQRKQQKIARIPTTQNQTPNAKSTATKEAIQRVFNLLAKRKLNESKSTSNQKKDRLGIESSKKTSLEKLPLEPPKNSITELIAENVRKLGSIVPNYDSDDSVETVELDLSNILPVKKEVTDECDVQSNAIDLNGEKEPEQPNGVTHNGQFEQKPQPQQRIQPIIETLVQTEKLKKVPITLEAVLAIILGDDADEDSSDSDCIFIG